jgi:hypothetical protein
MGGPLTEVAPSPFGACELVLTEPEGKPRRRNYAAERAIAKERKIAELVKIRLLRDENQLGKTMFQMSQAFIACSVMRYSPTTERQISQTARLADSVLTVTITAALKDVAMPFGADRTLLYWIFDKAVKTGSPFVSLESIAPYLEEMGFSNCGKNRTDMIDRLERLFGMVIGIERSNADISEGEILRVFSRSRLPKGSRFHSKYRASTVPEEYRGRVGMLISPEVYADLQKYHVAVPLEVIRLHKDKPRMLDISLFLYWRSFAAQSSSLIRWSSLEEQLGHPDTNIWRLRETVGIACQMWKTIWPEFNCESNCEGLWIRPPRRGVHLLAEGKKSRNLELPLSEFSTDGM